jgi:hypothetical protein
MYFVKDHETDSRKFGIVLQTPRQNSFGNDFNTRIGSDASLITRLIANKITWFLSDQRGEAAGCGASGKSTWLEHHDALTTKPVFVDKAKWNERGFSGAWRSDKNRSESSN